MMIDKMELDKIFLKLKNGEIEGNELDKIFLKLKNGANIEYLLNLPSGESEGEFERIIQKGNKIGDPDKVNEFRHRYMIKKEEIKNKQIITIQYSKNFSMLNLVGIDNKDKNYLKTYICDPITKKIDKILEQKCDINSEIDNINEENGVSLKKWKSLNDIKSIKSIVDKTLSSDAMEEFENYLRSKNISNLQGDIELK
jgi:hypothetical protein